MKKIVYSFSLTMLLGMFVFSPQWAEPSSPSPALKLAAAAAPGSRDAWKERWDRTLAEAKKEGAASLYALWRPDTRVSLTKAFKQKYGIDLEVTPFSRGADLLAKVKTEQAAGIFLADIFGAGGPTLVATMKPAGVLGPVEPLLILPEVMDPTAWSGGKFPFLDKDKLATGMIASKQPYMAYNTDLIKKGEITTYKDLLKPQYKGKITLNDPTVTGVGNAFMSHLALHIWNLEEAKEFLSQLIKQQDVVIQRDNRIHIESVARGKFAIGLAPNPDNLADFLKLKAPVAVVPVKEGSFVTPAAGAFSLPPKLAHPNAARVFINWLLTKEGQEVFARSFGSPSMRADASTEGINPAFVVRPGEKLFLDNEESILFRGKMRGIAKEVIEKAGK